MARADLLVSLVQASAEGDRGRVRKTTEAIIAEERAKTGPRLAPGRDRAGAATAYHAQRSLLRRVRRGCEGAGDHHETGEIKRVVTSLLMEVDELPSYTVTVAATNHPELLDRAVWHRFQLRLSLDAPSERDLAGYLERFVRSLGEGLGHAPARLAARLGPVSYAEAEEFCLDVKKTVRSGVSSPGLV